MFDQRRRERNVLIPRGCRQSVLTSLMHSITMVSMAAL
jgi:hypothetical protein